MRRFGDDWKDWRRALRTTWKVLHSPAGNICGLVTIALGLLVLIGLSIVFQASPNANIQQSTPYVQRKTHIPFFNHGVIAGGLLKASKGANEPVSLKDIEDILVELNERSSAFQSQNDLMGIRRNRLEECTKTDPRVLALQAEADMDAEAALQAKYEELTTTLEQRIKEAQEKAVKLQQESADAGKEARQRSKAHQYSNLHLARDKAQRNTERAAAQRGELSCTAKIAQLEGDIKQLQSVSSKLKDGRAASARIKKP